MGFLDDMAQEIATAFAGELKTGTLTKISTGTRTTGSLTAGTNPTTVSHVIEGFVEVAENRRRGQLGSDPVVRMTIITKLTVPAAVPEVGDQATLESITYDIVRIIERDPAAATYVCEVQ